MGELYATGTRQTRRGNQVPVGYPGPIIDIKWAMRTDYPDSLGGPAVRDKTHVYFSHGLIPPSYISAWPSLWRLRSIRFRVGAENISDLAHSSLNAATTRGARTYSRTRSPTGRSPDALVQATHYRTDGSGCICIGVPLSAVAPAELHQCRRSLHRRRPGVAGQSATDPARIDNFLNTQCELMTSTPVLALALSAGWNQRPGDASRSRRSHRLSPAEHRCRSGQAQRIGLRFPGGPQQARRREARQRRRPGVHHFSNQDAAQHLGPGAGPSAEGDGARCRCDCSEESAIGVANTYQQDTVRRRQLRRHPPFSRNPTNSLRALRRRERQVGLRTSAGVGGQRPRHACENCGTRPAQPIWSRLRRTSFYRSELKSFSINRRSRTMDTARIFRTIHASYWPGRG